MISSILATALIVDSILVTIVVLLQSPGEGGLSASFGGSTFHTRRGSEKTFHELTVFLGIVFVALAVATLLVR